MLIYAANFLILFAASSEFYTLLIVIFLVTLIIGQCIPAIRNPFLDYFNGRQPDATMLSKEEKKQLKAFQTVPLKWNGSFRNNILAGIAFVFFITPLAVGYFVYDTIFIQPFFLMAIGSIIYDFLSLSCKRMTTLQYLYEKGHSTLCPKCEFDLRDFKPASCPDCGFELKERIVLHCPECRHELGWKDRRKCHKCGHKHGYSWKTHG